ncbi:MAG: ABC transporter substrate-binding protein [Clostridia bacterium]|nr:ABC transporter substrate-binding protein [Clostridia bacterium]MBR4013093.1 ABC transporter substrate-binding protein [Clostridia bacterium]
MKKAILKVLALCMCAAMLLCSLVACGDKKNDKIVIGLTGPLTGGASIYGIAVRNSAQMAVDEINEAGGLNGIEFKLDMRDDEHKAENVANLYTGLVEDGMQVSLGTVTTKPGLEFKNLSKDDNVFFLTPSATGDAIPEYDNGYQMCFADSNQGTAAAEFFNENYVGKKIGIFFKADDEYSKGINDNFKAALDDSFDVTEANFTGDASTFDSQIATLKDCEIVFMPIYYTPASQFMTQAKSVDNSITTYYGCDGFDGIDAIEGFDITSIPQEISMLSHFNSTATEGPAAEFIKKYNDKYDEAKEPLNQFGAAAYDCVYAIYEALKVAVENGKEVTAETSASEMCDILTEVFNSDSFEFRGITGKCEGNEKSHISWSEDGTVVKEAIKYIVKEKNA